MNLHEFTKAMEEAGDAYRDRIAKAHLVFDSEASNARNQLTNDIRKAHDEFFGEPPLREYTMVGGGGGGGWTPPETHAGGSGRPPHGSGAGGGAGGKHG